MHILRPIFAIEREEALDFATQRGFGLLVAFDGQKPIASHVPFVLARTGDAVAAEIHLTLANPLAQQADGHTDFLLAVSGPDVYVSNDYYASSDQISTWLYEAVHLTGPARRLAPEENRQHGDVLLNEFEARLAPKEPWTLDMMDAQKRAMMLAGIVTVRLAVRTVEGQRKLNQHKPDIDHIAVVQALQQSTEPNAAIIAERMRMLRPHLNYGDA